MKDKQLIFSPYHTHDPYHPHHPCHHLVLPELEREQEKLNATLADLRAKGIIPTMSPEELTRLMRDDEWRDWPAHVDEKETSK